LFNRRSSALARDIDVYSVIYINIIFFEGLPAVVRSMFPKIV
jgi:hypothetical protein